ncbi:hypothetical protein Hanom_Chr11g01029221 [Helianthus anomalus]
MARPRACLHICCFWSWGEVRRVGMMYQLSFFCTYADFCLSFVSFVHLSSFKPENQKYTKKHTFSNISTKNG